MVTFKSIDSVNRGDFFKMLKSAYAEILVDDAKHREQYLKDWQKFDDEVFNNPDTVGKCVRISFVDGEVVGFMSYDPRNLPDFGIVGQNCVLPEFRGQGYGREQIEEILKIFKERGAKKVIVTTGDSAFYLPARKNYESIGFREISRAPKPSWGYGEINYELVF